MLLLLPLFLLLSLVDGQKTPEQICSRLTSDPLKKACCKMTQERVRLAKAVVAAGLVNKEIPCASPDPGADSAADINPSPQGGARAAPAAAEADATPAATTPADLTETYKCMDIPCVCRGYGGTTNADNTCTVRRNGRDYTFGKAVRQECRTLSSTQWANLVRAIQTLKWGPGQNTYNRYVYEHRYSSAPTAHGGPMFCNWHREFLKRYEMDLRQIDPSVSLCYWDSSLDDELEDSRQSCVWTADFWGEARDNRVINGPYANWTSVEGFPLERSFGGPKGCISRADAQAIPRYPLLDVMAFTDEYETCQRPDEARWTNWPFEYIHGGPHNFIGGDMSSTETSPNDPCFYHHHCYIDYILERWRTYVRGQGNDPTNYYPESLIVNDQCSRIENSLEQAMLPFREIINRLSLSNAYLNNLYSYIQSPTCTRTRGCGSPYLFCCYNPSPTRCVAKIQIGGNCGRFSTPSTSSQTTLPQEQTNPCYKGRCVSGICRTTTTSLLDKPEFLSAENDLPDINLASLRILPKINIPSFRVCYNYHECCPTWSKDGHCTKSVFFMNIWCPASCKCDGCYERPTPRGGDACRDIHPSCKKWLQKKRTECQANPRFMKSNCAKSCGFCNPRQSVEAQCSGGPMAKGYFVSREQLKLEKLQGEPDEN